MLLVFQRCNSAEVSISKKVISKIKVGMVLLLGVEKTDTINDVLFLVNKVVGLSIFNDNQNKLINKRR